MRLVTAAILTLTPIVASACGSNDDALSKAQDGLAKIRSGTLSVRLEIQPTGVSDGNTGFTLAGPFSFAGGGALPKMRLAYTQIAGTRRASVTLVSDGHGAWVQTGGRTYRLSSAQTAPMRQVSGPEGGLHALGIDFDRWVRNAEVADGPKVDGVATERITGTVDVARALDDLLAAGRRAGAATALSDQAKRGLTRSVTRSRAVVIAGRDDHIPRRMDLDVRFVVRGEAQGLLGGLRGATAHLSIGISRPNTPVRISAPAGARGAAPLPAG